MIRDESELPPQIIARFEREDALYASCPSGWLPLVIELDAKLAELAPTYTVQQIKEKFAGLRYYVEIPLYGDGSARNKAYDLISEYEERSYRICDMCGSTEGKEHSIGGWMRTLCTTHAEETGASILQRKEKT